MEPTTQQRAPYLRPAHAPWSLARLSFTAIALLAGILRAQAPQAATPPVDAHQKAYVLGTDDQLVVQVLDLEEIRGDHPIRVDMQGNIRLPIVGRLHVAGLTVEQTEDELRKRLTSVLREPEVVVMVAEFRPHPVSVLGSVRTPGVFQLTGKKTLSEVLSLAGGANIDAGNTIVITRRKETGPLPLPDCQLDGTGEFYIAHVSLKSLLESRNPLDNIAIESGDAISVPKGELVYVIGAVPKQGGIVLNERETLTVLQVVSLSGGFERFANQKQVEILRLKPGATEREQIFVDVKAMLTNKTKDVPILANDILFVPISGKKAATVRAVEAMIGMGTTIGQGLAVYRY
jgi:polysaccharide export outer membrane protein